MHAHLYAATDSRRVSKIDRMTAYLLTVDDKKGYRFEYMAMTDCSRHRAILAAIAAGLKRFTKPCDVTIHADDKWVLNMLSNNLDTWARSNYCSNKGDPVENRDFWKQIHESMEMIRAGGAITVEAGEHKYTHFMLEKAYEQERSGE